MKKFNNFEFVTIDGHHMNLNLLIKMRACSPLKIKERSYLRDTAYRRAAIMHSLRFSPAFADSGWYLSDEEVEAFFDAAHKKDYAIMNRVLNSLEGVRISERDLATPPLALIETPTAEEFCRTFGGRKPVKGKYKVVEVYDSVTEDSYVVAGYDDLTTAKKVARQLAEKALSGYPEEAYLANRYDDDEEGVEWAIHTIYRGNWEMRTPYYGVRTEF